jgi:hypothetical protein
MDVDSAGFFSHISKKNNHSLKNGIQYTAEK